MEAKETKTHEFNEYEYKEDYLADLEQHDNVTKDFDPYEAMLIGQVYDSVSKSVNGSSITDSYAATLAIERAARVLGKLPDGTVEAMAKKDGGKAMFMDIIRQKWIYPNANSQHSFEEKLRMWQLYSSVYGYMPMFYDWEVNRNTGYIGPDCWLWNPRNLIPQQGKVSIEDMDYVTALSWVGKRTIQKWQGTGKDAGWDKKALEQLLEASENKTEQPNSDRDSLISRNRNKSSLKKGVCIATRYEAGEAGEWITLVPDNSCLVLRRIKNPHKNGRIPFVIKYSQPLFDNFYGMGDFQRAKPLQFARDGLTNFYFQGLKMNLIPPIIANSNGVLKHTMDYRPGAVMFETIPNSIRRMETSTAGLSTYQAAQSQLTGSLLSLYGTQNASIPGAEALNPSQGKTPGAIDMYSEKEATRDGMERANLEAAIEKLTDGFFSLIANIGTEDIPVNLFSEDIDEIVAQGYDDLLEMVQPSADGNSGVLVIDPESLRNSEYRFNIAPGSTAAVSKMKQIEGVNNFLGTLAKFQNLLKEDPSVKVEYSKIFKLLETLSGVKGLEDIITIIPPEVLQAQQQQQMMMQAQAQAAAQSPQAPQQPALSVRGQTINDPELQQIAQQIEQS